MPYELAQIGTPNDEQHPEGPAAVGLISCYYRLLLDLPNCVCCQPMAQGSQREVSEPKPSRAIMGTKLRQVPKAGQQGGGMDRHSKVLLH